MKQVITIGSALIDIFVYADAFAVRQLDGDEYLCQKYGDKIELKRLEMHAGGGGANTAVGFASMGFKSAVVGETGKDTWSHVVLSELEKKQVATEFVIREKREQTGGSVILTGKDGGRTVMVHRGAAALLDPEDIPAQALKTADWIHVSSIAGNVETLKTIFTATQHHHLSWNPGKAELKALVNGSLNVSEIPAQMLFLNKEEWELVKSIQPQLKEQIKIIIVTDGKNGGIVYEQGQEVTNYAIQQVPTVEETGAGDAFVVGFVSGYLYGYTPTECAEFGKRTSAAVVQSVGAQNGYLTKADLF